MDQQFKRGMKHFADNPEKVGTKQWNVFKRTVLKPYSELLMSEFTPEEKVLAERLLSEFGGFVVKAGDCSPA